MARFVVSNVFQVVGRGRGVIGQPVEGHISVGMSLHKEHGATPVEWRVTDVGSADSPSIKEYNVSLILENAPGLDELRALFPPGSVLVGDQLDSQQRGFTLVEILAVIVVIAMLASLVAPNIFQNISAGKDATGRSQIETLGGTSMPMKSTAATTPVFPSSSRPVATPAMQH